MLSTGTPSIIPAKMVMLTAIGSAAHQLKLANPSSGEVSIPIA